MLHYSKTLYYSFFLLLCLPWGEAMAVSRSMQAEMAFVTPLKLAVTSLPEFGTVAAHQAGTYILSTAGAVTAREGSVATKGNQSAGIVTITGTSEQIITIRTGNYITSNGVTPSDATCKYGTAPIVACNDTSLATAAAPGTETTLLLGLQIVTTAQHEGVVATPGFDITIMYN